MGSSLVAGPRSVSSGPGSSGHGRRLIAAFETLERFPALARSQARLLAATQDEYGSVEDVVAAVESDVAFVIAVLRLANGRDLDRPVGTVQEAVETLASLGVSEVARETPALGSFESSDLWGPVPARFRIHALATYRAADRLAATVAPDQRDEVVTLALVHDVGKLVLVQAYPHYAASIGDQSATPDAGMEREREELGIDHASVGGVLARRWGLPDELTVGIERHHAADGAGQAAIVRAADMLAHFAQGQPVDLQRLLALSRGLGLSEEMLSAVMYELPPPLAATDRQKRACPLSARQLQVLQGLAEGKVYKQVAADLSLSVSTVRNHVHHAYRSLGAADRTQAILIAHERG